MDSDNENDTYEDQFLFEIDKAIETGNINIILNAIQLYKNVISESYIVMANNIYYELISEKLGDISIIN